jgi:hypothetical protein
MEKSIPNKELFINEVFRIAEERGFRIETNQRNGLQQIDFGHKKLHAGHLEQLYPAILTSTEKISNLIEKVASGRPCTHKPMREILSKIREKD